jgi:leucyl aminopeptidase
MATFSVSRDKAIDVACDVLAVPVFTDLAAGAGVKDVEAALGTTLASLSEEVPNLGAPSSQFKGKVGEALLVSTLGRLAARNVLFVGLGDKAGANIDVARKAGATVARRAGGGKVVATTITQSVKGGEAAAGAFAEGFGLATYKYMAYKAESNSRPNRVEKVLLVVDKKSDTRKLNTAVQRGEILAEATNMARDLKNTPSSDKSPESLAEVARGIKGLKVTVLDEKQLAQKGFGGIIGVGRGSAKPPRLVQLRWEPAGAKRTIAFVGKGIIFDSGGISLKPGEGMQWMKMDMGGAAAVLGAMYAVSRLKPKVRVHGYVCTAENMPDGNATRPGDVLKMYSGKTVEVDNTDAEGRLVLADGITLAIENGADAIVDIATLTGACAVALGNKVFGALGSPRAEVRRVLDAAERAGEKAWELPLVDDYAATMKGEIADLRNIPGKNPGGGAITAALFLKEFAGDTPWVHLDIAGPMKSDEDSFEWSKGATGVGVRTLVEYALAQ